MFNVWIHSARELLFEVQGIHENLIGHADVIKKLECAQAELQKALNAARVQRRIDIRIARSK